jgi:hypothetical protein
MIGRIVWGEGRVETGPPPVAWHLAGTAGGIDPSDDLGQQLPGPREPVFPRVLPECRRCVVIGECIAVDHGRTREVGPGGLDHV